MQVPGGWWGVVVPGRLWCQVGCEPVSSGTRWAVGGVVCVM